LQNLSLGFASVVLLIGISCAAAWDECPSDLLLETETNVHWDDPGSLVARVVLNPEADETPWLDQDYLIDEGISTAKIMIGKFLYGERRNYDLSGVYFSRGCRKTESIFVIEVKAKI
jgi:hypothetical protein